MAKKERILTAFGETRTLMEWANALHPDDPEKGYRRIRNNLARKDREGLTDEWALYHNYTLRSQTMLESIVNTAVRKAMQKHPELVSNFLAAFCTEVQIQLVDQLTMEELNPLNLSQKLMTPKGAIKPIAVPDEELLVNKEKAEDYRVQMRSRKLRYHPSWSPEKRRLGHIAWKYLMEEQDGDNPVLVTKEGVQNLASIMVPFLEAGKPIEIAHSDARKFFSVTLKRGLPPPDVKTEAEIIFDNLDLSHFEGQV